MSSQRRTRWSSARSTGRTCRGRRGWWHNSTIQLCLTRSLWVSIAMGGLGALILSFERLQHLSLLWGRIVSSNSRESEFLRVGHHSNSVNGLGKWLEDLFFTKNYKKLWDILLIKLDPMVTRKFPFFFLFILCLNWISGLNTICFFDLHVCCVQMFSHGSWCVVC